MTSIKSREIFEQDEMEQDHNKNDDVVYYSFLPLFDDDDTYKMSDSRKQAFIRVAKWLFDCAGVSVDEFMKLTALDKPNSVRD